MALPVETIDAQTVASILTEIAETASETLELQDVFGRIAASVRRAIPLDHMGVVRIVNGAAIKQASTFGTWAAWKDGQMEASPEPEPGCSAACMHPCSLDIWSPRIRPQPGPIPRVNDTRAELDPSFEGDARILESGARSTMWEPFRTDKGFVGGVWVSASEPRAFTDEHQEILRPVAALLGTAVEHWRIWDAE